jgi:hypothetical protein
MIAVVRRLPPIRPIRARSEPRKDSKPPAKKEELQPAGHRSGTGASSVLPYLTLPR